MKNNLNINIDKDILGGTPVFTGTRVPIKTFFEWLETETLNEFLENFPSVSREKALSVLKYAENFVVNNQIENEITS